MMRGGYSESIQTLYRHTYNIQCMQVAAALVLAWDAYRLTTTHRQSVAHFANAYLDRDGNVVGNLFVWIYKIGNIAMHMENRPSGTDVKSTRARAPLIVAVGRRKRAIQEHVWMRNNIRYRKKRRVNTICICDC